MSFFKSFFGESDKEQPKRNRPPMAEKPKENRPQMAEQPKENRPEMFFLPRILEINRKLTIILVENTNAVFKEKNKLEKIVKSLATTGRVCVISYGSSVTEGKIVEAKDFDSSTLLNEKTLGESARLFDALIALAGIITRNYNKSEELKSERIIIKPIDIIGMGRCIDNASIASSESAIEQFCKVIERRDITTKYFCLSEDGFVEAAKIGFHSIGAIPRN